MAAFQNLWFYLYSSYNPFVLDCIFPFLASVLSYAIFNIPFLLIDILGCPKSLLKHKVQPTVNVPVSIEKVKGVIGPLIFNMVGIGFALSYFFYRLRLWSGYQYGPDLPTASEFAKHMAIMTVVEEVGFYYTHRLFHTSFLYKRIHKKHHEWSAPISLVSQYCHPLEHLLSNALPVYIGPWLTGAHPVTSYFWHMAVMYGTISIHSGYKFPFTPSPVFHDFHHEKFTQNFGVWGYLDKLHGTKARWQYISKNDKEK